MRRALALLGAAAVLFPAVAVAGAQPAQADSAYVLRLAFDEADGAGRAKAFRNDGSGDVNVSAVTENGGHPRWSGSPTGTGLRLPAFALGDGPHAVLQVRDTRGTDELSPGSRGFGFGADFRLDKQPQVANPRDNGENLIQRGLATQAAQFKLQVDHQVPSCAVHGAYGKAAVSASALPVGKWYRATCTLSLGRLSLTVARLGKDGQVKRATVRSVAAEVGPVDLPASVPMSVGGKLAGVDRLASGCSVDQFNGRVDNVVYWLG
ncbi:MAG TPA: hypothetical protein VFJ97_14905 [Dermatophilaceae bacterium]|nr:hypothetical protein [Dermatophilaceae bacterium]